MFLNTEGKYGKYIVQDLHDPNLGSQEFQEMYKKFSKRILWIDSNVVDGAFQMNTAWYLKLPERDPVFEEHTHEYDELLGFFGSNPEKPYELGAEMEVTLNGEIHRITKTSLIFCPAGMKHMPLRIKKVNHPIFHFSIVISPEYSGIGVYK